MLIGIFVGGAGKRMGGVAKGLLRTPRGDETLIGRLLAVCGRAAPQAPRYLVGVSPEYASLEVTQLPDDPSGTGPIGGLRSLLLRARADGAARVLALACDLPFLDETMIASLLEPLHSAARVPLVDERFQPLAAAYATEATLAAVDRALSLGKRALMHVLDELGDDLEPLELEGVQARALRDWDTPDDMQNH
ncbi:MAG TPA: molybdenum cofactor guanylyltransferase [Polyangiaceae bacterium]|jgi:molybdopterin-guanine dinucleotide biosynthesis protein A